MPGNQSLEVKDVFEVSPYTMAVIGVQGNSEILTYSRVLEVDGEFTINLKSTTIIDKSCKYFGSSLRGRLEGTRELTGISYKPPIAVDPTNGIYMFPTVSIYKDACAWLAHSHILNYESISSEKTKVIFNNHESVILDISKGSFENQLNKTAQFRYKLSRRFENRRWF